MTLRTITPAEARRLIDDGAVLVDVREADEHARERIPGARNAPLSRLEEATLPTAGRPIIYHCRSGARTLGHADRLALKAEGCEAYLVEGGLEAWRKAGLPVAIDRTQPLDLQRQVQLGAGSMAFVGTLLGLLVSPWFFVVPGVVGAGLMVAGLTGFCGLARLLVYAPWNRTLVARGS